MNATAGSTLLLMLAASMPAACGRSSPPPAARDERLEPDPEDVGAGLDGRPESMVEECEGAYTLGTLPDPWFLTSPPRQCLDSIAHDRPELYDDCVSNDTSPQGCGAPSTGAIVCEGNGSSWMSRTTQLCLADGDCPAGARCVLEGVPVSDAGVVGIPAHCEKTCTGDGGAAECVRCDLECDTTQGLCRAKRTVRSPEPCEHTCQCSQAGDVCGQDGLCFGTLAPTQMYFCGERGTCACNGGQCVDGCCIMPDGTMAGPRDAACRP